MKTPKQPNPRNQKLIEQFASNVRKYRNAKGLTMDQLADLVGVQKGAIVTIELAKVNTTISTATAISIALGVSLDELIKS